MGSAGRARIEAFEQAFTNVTPLNVATFSRPGTVFLPANAPRVRATQITLADSTVVAIPASPTGSFVMPDAVVNTTGHPVTVGAQAPVGATGDGVAGNRGLGMRFVP